jgi:hypothetical protein
MGDIWLLLVGGAVAIVLGFVARWALRLAHFKYIKFNRSRTFKKQVRRYRYWAPAIILGLLSFPAITYLLKFYSHPISSTAAEWGQMGDFFGGMLNPILAFASFIALLYTIRIQSRELELTRQEFEKSVEAQREMATEARGQVQLMGMQNVLNTFNAYYGVLERTIDKDGTKIGALSIQHYFSYNQYVSPDGNYITDNVFIKETLRGNVLTELMVIKQSVSSSCVNTDSVNALFETLFFLHAQLKFNDESGLFDALDRHNSVILGCGRLSVIQMNQHIIFNVCLYYILINPLHEQRKKIVVDFGILDVVFSRLSSNKGLSAALYFMLEYGLEPNDKKLLSGYSNLVENIKFKP